MADEHLQFEIDGDTRGFSRAMSQAVKASKQMTTALSALANEGQDAEGEIDDVGKAIQDYGGRQRKATAQTKEMTGSLSKLALQFSLVDRAVGGALRVVSSFARGIVDAHKAGIGLNLSFQTMEVRLQGVVGSAAGAQKAMDAFRRIAATTAFSVRDVSEAGTTLAAFMGGQFTKNIEGTTKAVADLSAFMGLSATEGASAMGRAFAGGAGAADILRERGILNLIKSFKGIEDLTKLTLPEFRAALLDTMVNTEGPIAGATNRMSETTVGAISNMGDAWETFVANLTEGAMPALRDFARAVGDIFNEAAGQVEGEKGLGNAIERLTRALEGNKDEIVTSLKAIATVAGKTAEALALMVDAAILLGRFSPAGLFLKGLPTTEVQETLAKQQAAAAKASEQRVTALRNFAVPPGSDAATVTALRNNVLSQRPKSFEQIQRDVFADAEKARKLADAAAKDVPTIVAPTLTRRRPRAGARITPENRLLPRATDRALHGARQSSLSVVTRALREMIEGGARFLRDPSGAAQAAADRRVSMGRQPGSASQAALFGARNQIANVARQTELENDPGMQAFRAFLMEIEGADFRGTAQDVANVGKSLDDVHTAAMRAGRGSDSFGKKVEGVFGKLADALTEWGDIGIQVLSEMTGGFRGVGGSLAGAVVSGAQGDVGGFLTNSINAAKQFLGGDFDASGFANQVSGSLTGAIEKGIDAGFTGHQATRSIQAFMQEVVGASITAQVVDSLIKPELEKLGKLIDVDLGGGARRNPNDILTDPAFREQLQAVFNAGDRAFQLARGADEQLENQFNPFAHVNVTRNDDRLVRTTINPETGLPVPAPDQGKPAGVTVTTISGAFRDVLTTLGNRRDNLLTEIRDGIRALGGDTGAELATAGAGGGPGDIGGTTIHVENVHVQTVADLDDLDGIIQDQFDVGLGRAFAKAKRTKGIRR